MGVARWHSALSGAVRSLARPVAAAAAWTAPALVPGSSGTPVAGLIATGPGKSQTPGSVVSAGTPG